MIQISESVELERAASDLWPLLSQPELMASCIPGATIERKDDGDYAGTISVKFGPTIVLFKGHCSITYDADNKFCSIEGRGIDGRGASRALARGTVKLEALNPASSRLAVNGEYSVNGPLQDFAQAGGVHVVRALMQDFARNITTLTAPTGNHGGDPLPKARPMNGLALIWKSLVVMCRSWLGTRSRSSS